MKTAAFSLIMFLIAFTTNAQEYVYSDYSEEYSVEATFISAFLSYTEDGNSYWTLKFTAGDGSVAEIKNYNYEFLNSLIEDGTPVNIGEQFIVTLMNVVDYYDDGSEGNFYFGVSCAFK